MNWLKKCGKCKLIKPTSAFAVDKSRIDGHLYSCKTCINKEYKANWYKKHKEQCRRVMLRNNYGLTLEEYDEMFEKQDGVCAICDGINSNDKRLFVDHNHETGEIRGLLCTRCNLNLGVIEKPGYLSKLLEYLQSSGSVL